VAFGLREVLKVCVALLAVAVLIAACSGQMANSWKIGSYGVISRLPWLHVEGQWIADEHGNRVALRGVGMDYVCYKNWDWVEQSLAAIKGRGYNSVRLAFTSKGSDQYGTWWDWRCTPYAIGVPPVYDDENMDKIIQKCEELGLYAILDFHSWWATEEYDGWECVLPKHESYWLDVWRHLATRYKDRSVVAAYEIYNEPLGEAPSPNGKGQYEMMIDCINAIRQIDTKHIIIVYDDFPNPYHVREQQAGIARRTIYDPTNAPRGNIVFATHHWQGDQEDSIALNQREAASYVEGLMLYREWMNAPVWAGEFGTYVYNTYAHANWVYVTEIIRLCDDLGIPWNYFQTEAFIKYSPGGVEGALSYVTPIPYTSNIYPADVPRPFTPKPFNLWDYVVNQSWPIGNVGQHRWASTWMNLPWSAFWVDLKGPIAIRRKVWNGPDRYNYPLIIDEIITIPAGTIARLAGTTYIEIYAQEKLAT